MNVTLNIAQMILVVGFVFIDGLVIGYLRYSGWHKKRYDCTPKEQYVAETLRRIGYREEDR